MRTKRWLELGTCALIATIAWAPSASVEAQAAWLAPRRAEGPGFAVGDFELHPGLGLEVGYDSNLYYTSDDGRPIVGRSYSDSAILRATAHLLFGPRGDQRSEEGESGGGGGEGSSEQRVVTFRGGLSGSFYHFFNDDSRTNMELDAQLALGILPGRPFSINITEDFGRSIRPFAENTDPGASYARIQNNAGLQLNFATTGEVLKIAVGYQFGLNFFEDSLFQFGNSFQHTLTLSETFRFLPQTALVHDTTFAVTDYYNPAGALDPLVLDGYRVRTRVGINGAFTPEFSVLAMVGYTAGFFESPARMFDQEYESIAVQLEARWQIERNARLSFGYDRDFQPSFIGNWYSRDRGYAAFQYLIGGSFMLGIDASVSYYQFGVIESAGGGMLGTTPTREDIRLIGSLFGEYRFTDWLGVNATFTYTGNFTDYQYTLPTAGTDPAQFNKFSVWLGVRVFY